MCFGRSSGSAYSSSSSSSDEPNVRVIDISTLRRLNSPRCALSGTAYTPGAQAASDRAALRTAAAAQAVMEDKQKTGELSLLPPLRALLTSGDSQEVISSS
jgi:hypothetical protein